MMTTIKCCALAVLITSVAPGSAYADTYGHVQGTSNNSEYVIAAKAFKADGQWAKAVPLLETRNAGYPDEVETLADLGHVYTMTGDPDLGVEKLKVAL